MLGGLLVGSRMVGFAGWRGLGIIFMEGFLSTWWRVSVGCWSAGFA